VEVKVDGQHISVKGSKGELDLNVHQDVEITQNDGALQVAARSPEKRSRAMAGTTRALVFNMVTGVSTGFERRLQLQGVGYRAQAQGKKLNLQLGFSHPVEYELPEGISVETPSQTEIVVTGTDKQLVGQVSAEIRAFRPPEPYKGKGVRYANERVRRKEAKKK
jgi:large subunit ribosomal protein L6